MNREGSEDEEDLDEEAGVEAVEFFNRRSSSSSYKQGEVKFMTILSKQVYTYTAVKGVII